MEFGTPISWVRITLFFILFASPWPIYDDAMSAEPMRLSILEDGGHCDLESNDESDSCATWTKLSAGTEASDFDAWGDSSLATRVWTIPRMDPTSDDEFRIFQLHSVVIP